MFWKIGPSEATADVRAAQSAPPTAAPAWRRPAVLAAASAFAVALLAVGALALRTEAPPPMALAPAAPPAAAAPSALPAEAPPAAPAPAPTIALGWSPGDRSAPVPADAAFAHLGPVELVSGAAECYVEARYQDAGGAQAARLWGPCAQLGFPDAQPPAPATPSPPPPRPAAPAPPADAPPAPAAEAPPADLVPIPAERPFGARPKPDRGRP